MRDFSFLAAFNIIAICVWGLLVESCKLRCLQQNRTGFLDLKLDRINDL